MEAVRVQVLMSPTEAERFNAYCREMGYKKSPLIARLVRQHLDREGFRTRREPVVEHREASEA